VSLAAGAIAFVVGAWAGLRVSLQQICGVSILVQCVLTILWLLPLSLSVMPFAVALPLAIVVIHVYNVLVIRSARAQGKEYPWHILKWTFLLTAVAVCAIFILLLTVEPWLLLDPFFLLFAAMITLPSCLQVVLLWWPRNREQEGCFEIGDGGALKESTIKSDYADSTEKGDDA
jgi:hypothetical protein